MAITVEESQSVGVTARSRGCTFDTTWTPAENDLVVLLGATTVVDTITTPATWINVLGGNTAAVTDAHTSAMVIHWVTAAEAAAVTRNYQATNLFATSSAGNTCGLVLRGVDPTTPVDAAASVFSSSDATPHVTATLPGASLSTGSLVVGGLVKDTTGVWPTPATGWTTQTFSNSNQASALGTRDTLTTAGVDVGSASYTPPAGDEYTSIVVAFTAASGVAASSTGGFFSFLPAFRTGGDPPPPAVYDAGLNETFLYADPATGATRSVVTYGATPDNSSNDDAPAFASAMAACVAGDTMYLPNGTYHVKGSAGLSVKEGVSVVGESEAGAIVATMFTAAVGSVFTCAPGIDNVNFSDFSIRKQSGSNFLAGIKTGSSASSSVDNTRIGFSNLTVENHQRFGIEINNGKHILVDGCTIKNAVALDGGGSGYGVIFGGASCNNCWVRNTAIGPVIRHAVVLQECHHCLVGGLGTPNNITGCVSGCIDLHGEGEYSNEVSYNVVHDLVLDGTTISANGGAIEVGEPPSAEHDRSGTYNWLHHNELYNCPYGVRIMNQSNFTIVEDNEIYGCDYGVMVEQLSGYTITGVDNPVIKRNNIHDNDNGVVMIDTVTDAIVQDNTIIDNTGYGIYGDANTDGYVITGNTISGNGTDVSLAGTGTYVPYSGGSSLRQLVAAPAGNGRFAFRLFGGADSASRLPADKTKYQLYMISPYMTTMAAAIRAANPTAVILFYKDASSMRRNLSDAASVWCPADGGTVGKDWGVQYCDSITNHPTWFMTEGSANFQYSGYSYHWHANVGASGYKERWKSNVEADLVAHTDFDGVLIDNQLTDIRAYVPGGSFPDQYSTLAAGHAAYQGFIDHVSGLTTSGFHVIANMANARLQAGLWDAYVVNQSGGFDETWESFGDSGGGVPNNLTEYTEGWSRQMAELDDSVTDGKLGIFSAQSTGLYECAIYGYASFLLGTNGTQAFMESNYDSDGQDYVALRTMYGWQLGAALGPRSQVSGMTSLWERSFADGRVFVNAHASTNRTVSLGGTYIDESGASVTSITVNAARARILRN